MLVLWLPVDSRLETALLVLAALTDWLSESAREGERAGAGGSGFSGLRDGGGLIANAAWGEGALEFSDSLLKSLTRLARDGERSPGR